MVDLKPHGTAVYVEAARLYALAHGIAATGTRDASPPPAARSAPARRKRRLVGGFEFLQMLRLQVHLATRTRAAGEDQNLVEVAMLDDIDRRILKESFASRGACSSASSWTTSDERRRRRRDWLGPAKIARRWVVLDVESSGSTCAGPPVAIAAVAAGRRRASPRIAIGDSFEALLRQDPRRVGRQGQHPAARHRVGAQRRRPCRRGARRLRALARERARRVPCRVERR